MNRTMNLKGFVLILGIILLVFLVVHSLLGSKNNEASEKEKALRVQQTRLEEENKALVAQQNAAGTQEFIMSVAVKDYSYVQKEAIRFEFSNPEALYAYTQEEMQILMDEMND